MRLSRTGFSLQSSWRRWWRSRSVYSGSFASEVGGDGTPVPIYSFYPVSRSLCAAVLLAARDSPRAPVVVADVAAESNVGITITIVGGLTEISVARGLTSSEVKAVMDIVNKGQA